MFDAKKRAVAIRGSLVGGGRSTTQTRVDAVARALDRAYCAGLEEAAKICESEAKEWGEAWNGSAHEREICKACAGLIRARIGQDVSDG